MEINCINGLKIISLNTVIVGTGAAGFNAADRLFSYGQKDIAIVTDHVMAGTSRNTGSDKQTYYKLTLSGDEPDSVLSLAENLFSGGCVDGDIALCEAALSTMSFLKLCDLGVPFPVNRYGEYIGYKTDHDPRRRATSVGPYTSKKMTECLEKAVNDKEITIFDGYQVVSVLTKDQKVNGLVCLNIKSTEREFVIINCTNVVFATGGPAGMYADSVFPFGHFGATGLAFEAGVLGKNLTEWQFGLASVKPRWNVSGTYMQVLPKFVSTDADGNDKREFLNDFFEENQGEMLSKIFLKGYQWPFDCRKVFEGSSIIDILVYIETYIKKRRIFLDFRANPNDLDVPFDTMGAEALEYLQKAGATFGKPIDRLLHMNKPAVDFYLDKGVDLTSEPLEIALCAQHNNGGLGIDKWWQTNVEGFFAVGEVAASHGVYRPGGSALNAGQVGSTRAAQYISKNLTQKPQENSDFYTDNADKIQKVIDLALNITSTECNVKELWDESAIEMSAVGGAIRNQKNIENLLTVVKNKLENFENDVKASSMIDLSYAFRYKDALICQFVYLEAMSDYIQKGGKSRGSALYFDVNGFKPYDKLSDIFTYSLEDGSLMDKIQEVCYSENSCDFSWRKVREIPTEDDFFENVWRKYRENGNIY
ncbi:MAG: FAD-binding protein [Clostridia bacterium]